MRYPRYIGSAAVLAVTALVTSAALAGPASAATRHGGGFGGASRVVFVQTDNTSGNQVVAYHRASDGTLSFAGTYNTGGLGGQLTGSVTDHLASQGSLTYDRQHSLLYAVNAGSNTVTVFVAHRDRLFRQQVISSGGAFPVSVTVHGNLVYVLNALRGGSVAATGNSPGGYFPLPGRSGCCTWTPRPAHSSPTHRARSPFPPTGPSSSSPPKPMPNTSCLGLLFWPGG